MNSQFELGKISGALALVPVAAFALALVHENVFYYVIGVDFFQSYEPIDVFRISIGYIFPTLFIFLFSAIMIVFDGPMIGESREIKYIARFFVALSGVTLVAYIFFGLNRELAAISVLVLLLTLAMSIRRSLEEKWQIDNYFSRYVPIVGVVFIIVAGRGWTAADQIVSGNRNDLIQMRTLQVELPTMADQKLWMVRDLSAGIIAVNSADGIFFIPRDQVEFMSSNVVPNRWRGLVCEVSDYCLDGKPAEKSDEWQEPTT